MDVAQPLCFPVAAVESRVSLLRESDGGAVGQERDGVNVQVRQAVFGGESRNVFLRIGFNVRCWIDRRLGNCGSETQNEYKSCHWNLR